MWNKPTEKQLAKLPVFYSTEDVPLKEKKIVMHFFFSGCDWYITEYSKEENMFFGFSILNNDLQNAEWGYIDFDELKSIKVKFLEVDRDIHWTVVKAIDVPNIKNAQGWN